jgi:hypothetical protein
MAEIDYSKLRGRIRERFGTEQAFAEAMEKTISQMSLLLNGKAVWRQVDIKKACDILGIADNDIGQYFFAEKVS